MTEKFWSDYDHYLVQLEFNFGFNEALSYHTEKFKIINP